MQSAGFLAAAVLGLCATGPLATEAPDSAATKEPPMHPIPPAAEPGTAFAPADFRDESASAARAAQRVPADTAVTGGVLQVTCPSNGLYRLVLQAPVPLQPGRTYHLELVCWARPLIEGRPHSAVLRYGICDGAGGGADPVAGCALTKTVALGEGGYKTYTFLVSVPPGAAPARPLLDVELTNHGLAETGGILKISRAAWMPEPRDRDVIPLWPSNRPPGQTDLPPNQEYRDADGRFLRDISRPRLVVYPPAPERRQPVGVLICSGGSFKLIEPRHAYAAWLNDLGITAFELQYRVPTKPLIALQDAQRAIRLVRARALALGIRTLGIMGDSAGAHLAILAATRSRFPSYEPVDAADAGEARPDFVISLCAPYVLLPDGTLNPDLTFDPTTPPMFLAHGDADKHTAVNSTTVYNALRQLGIPAELHIFSKAGHGIGIESETGRAWSALSERWMRTLGFLPAPDPR